MIVLAAIAPEEAAAGTPMPGKVKSPTIQNFFKGVLCPGRDCSPALIRGP